MKICKVCQSPFPSGQQGKTICSENCKKESEKKSYNNRYCKCNQCNKEFIATKGKLYCSAKCRKEYNKENRKSFLLLCEICGEMYQSKGHQGKYCTDKCYNKGLLQIRKSKEPKYEKTCPICNELFKTNNKAKVTCTAICQYKNKSLQAFLKHEGKFKNKHYRSLYIRNQLMRKNWIEKVDLKVLIERDKGICQLCNKPVDLTVHYNHSLAPTRDHIIPLTLNGEHSYKNCQLAHRGCNSKKFNKVM